MLIIGVAGPIAAGDDEFGRIALDAGYGWCSYSDCLRGLLKVWGREIARGSLQDLADHMREIDPEILSKIVHSSMKGYDKCCAGNIRNPFEAEYFVRWGRQAKERKFVLIHVDADIKTRFERARRRESERREGDPLTYEEFVKMEEKDLGVGQPWYGQQHAAVFRMADYRIENNGTKEEFRGQVFKLLKEIGIEYSKQAARLIGENYEHR